MALVDLDKDHNVAAASEKLAKMEKIDLSSSASGTAHPHRRQERKKPQ